WARYDGTVNEVPLGGGAVTTLATGLGYPVSLAADGTHVYWVDYDGSVNEVAVGGGSVTKLAGSQNHPVSLAVDGTHAYWINEGAGAGGSVNKVRLRGGRAVPLAPVQGSSNPQPHDYSLAVGP